VTQTPALTSLSRLAADTGGRFTERTNDLQLAYARAQRDLSCVYSLGFYVTAPAEQTPRKISVRVKRPGMRAIHPNRYVFRSDGEKRQSQLRAAWVAPEMFQTGVVRAHAYPLRPASKTEWEALLAVSFSVPLADSLGQKVQRQFGATLYQGSRVLHRFTRRVTLEPDHPDVESVPVITFLERVRLRPGNYSLTAVVSDPLDPRPHAVKVPIEVAPIPRDDLFLVQPMLGRPSGPNLIVIGGGAAENDTLGSTNSFEPLVVQQLDSSVDLVSLTQACAFGKPRTKLESRTRIGRELHRMDGELIGRLEPVPLQLEGDEKVRCQNLLDVFPAGSLRDGDYVFDVDLGTGRDGTGIRRRIRFAVGDATEIAAPG
jgi:hypothetical protein